MEIVTQVTKLLQGLFDEAMDAMARQAGCVKRERKLSGSTHPTRLDHPTRRLVD